MKALVTGGTGFLGGHLARRLQEEGWEVTVSGRRRDVGATFVARGIPFAAGDLADRDFVVAACRGQDAVFHCGALSSPWGAWRDFFRSNVEGTRHVVAGCRQHDVRRLVHVSTPSIYFDFRHRLEIRETDPLPARPVNAYARSKRVAEELVDEAVASGLPAITVRPRAVFGPGDTALFPRLLRAARRGLLPLVDGGRAVVDITCVENVVDALLLCQAAPTRCLGRKYNVTNGEPTELRLLLGAVCTRVGLRPRPLRLSYGQAMVLAALLEVLGSTILLGREPPLTRYSVGVLARSQTLSIEAARRDLGYQPRVTTAEGLDAFAEWWAREGATQWR